MVTFSGMAKGRQMAGLSDQITTEHQKGVGRPSRIEEILAQLDEEDAASLIAALNDLNIRAVTIYRVMGARGIKLSQTCISNYRAVINAAK